MTHMKKLKTALEAYRDHVEKCILKGDFVVENPIDITATIIVQGVTMQIWVANEPKNTKIYRLDYEDIEMSPELYFQDYHQVRNMIISKNIVDTAEEHY